MPYNANIPNPGDLLSVSQGDIKNNFSQANTSFGIDHSPFTDQTANAGFHQKVTTLPNTIEPVTAVNPVLYAFQKSNATGLLQFSRGPNNSVPTPITNIQSPVTAIVLAPTAITNVLDCTGLSRLIGNLYAFDSLNPTNVAGPLVIWNGTIFQIGATGNLKVQSTGNVLQIRNNGPSPMNIYWSFALQRLN